MKVDVPMVGEGVDNDIVGHYCPLKSFTILITYCGPSIVLGSCSRLQNWPQIPLDNVTFQLLPSRGEIYPLNLVLSLDVLWPRGH